MERLVERCRGLPVESVPLTAIGELDADPWFGGSGTTPTPRRIVEHCILIDDADLAYPIILSHDGRVIDGMHRVARALRDGATTIAAVRLPGPVAPDYTDCDPETLPY